MHTPRSFLPPIGGRYRIAAARMLAAIILAILACHGSLRAQLHGTKTIGSSDADYATLEDAISALSTEGVDGPVVFTLERGTITPPAEGYTLPAIPSMSASNTVTFRPAADATVLIDGDILAPIFTVSGKYYLLDGSNSEGSATRNMTLINRDKASAVLMLVDGAQNNTFRNLQLQGSATPATVGIISIGASTVRGGNSGNLFIGNQIGDPTGGVRATTGIFANGSAATARRNADNVIQDNDIVNFGTRARTGYGINIRNNNDRMRVFGNTIHNTSTSGVSGSMYGIYFSNSSSDNDSIAYNKIWSLNSDNPASDQFGIYIWIKSSSAMTIHDNMVSLIGDDGLLYGIYNTEPDPIDIDFNSVYIGGATAGAVSSFGIGNESSGATLRVRNNVVVNARTGAGEAGGSIINSAIYSESGAAFTSDHNLLYANGPGAAIGLYGTTSYADLAGWQQASGQDGESVSGSVPFANPRNGNLHVDHIEIFPGEGEGQVLDYPIDFDGQGRDPVTPDMGADDGNFNGGGIHLAYPNGGEQFPAGYRLTVEYTANRAMDVRIELSTDNGSTWIREGVVRPAIAGSNLYTFVVPDTVVDDAMVRVISRRNIYEADTSDALFSIVRPRFTLLAPNGLENLVPTDTATIQWSSEFVPRGMNVALEYSIDNGTTWLPIESDLASANSPGANSFAWVVPNTPSDRVLVRVGMMESPASDRSDTTLTILPQPVVEVVHPNGGEKLYAGEMEQITWNSVTTDYVDLALSTDAGRNWTTILDRIPAYLDSYNWRVPYTLTSDALVRITDHERPGFSDLSHSTFSILKSEILLQYPNGGEQFELNQPITVRWSALNTETVRIEYSTDNGADWQVLAASVPAANGAYTLTPPAIPSRNALLRVVNNDRDYVQDWSDAPFEIMPAKAIGVLAPGQGDQLVRGTTAWIYWDAPRITSVNILYSPNGGTTFTTVAANVPAGQGALQWNVPSQLTTTGMIRIIEVGGATIGDGGIFSIIDAPQPTINVVTPNGGESYTEGDPIVIRWNASADISTVTLAYTSDGGTSWTNIATNVTAGIGSYNWTAPNVPGTGYRVRAGNGVAIDASDADFTVVRRLQPALTLVRPNGGESFTPGSVETLNWNETDISGVVRLEYSTDNGTNWRAIGTVNAGIRSLSWTVPDSATTQALVRVIGASASDVSDAVFTIVPTVVRTITVTSPNGGEIWKEGETHQITWSVVGLTAADNVAIQFSTDGGVSWRPDVATTFPAVPGTFAWTIPAGSATASGQVRVVYTSDISVNDRSDGVFTVLPSTTNSVPDIAATGSGLQLLGNYPNPFATSTTLRWRQGASGGVTLRMYDGNGREVGAYELGQREAGQQQMTLQSRELPNGAYFYILQVGTTALRGTLILAR